MRRPKFLRKPAPERDRDFPVNERADGDEVDRQLESVSLEHDETVHYVARQHRIFPGGALLTPNTIYVTNKRIILRAPMLFGFRTHFLDVSFDRIAAVLLREGILTSALTISMSGAAVSITAIPKDMARNINDAINRYLRDQSWGNNETPTEKKIPKDLYR